MVGRRWLLKLVSILMLFIGASCLPSDRPYVRSVTSEPLVAVEGKLVKFTISYSGQEEQSFSETEIVVGYSQYLRFEQNAKPLPAEISEQQRQLVWKVGRLEKGESGSLWVEFRLATQIPREVYELQVAAEISAIGGSNNRVRHQRTGRALIEGHPTPTPLPTRTPEPTPRS